MALFINGVGQDSFSMNGVSVDNLYVDGVLVWSLSVPAGGIPPIYELAEPLVNDGSFDYLDNSSSSGSQFDGKLLTSGDAAWNPTVQEYPGDETAVIDFGTNKADTQWTPPQDEEYTFTFIENVANNSYSMVSINAKGDGSTADVLYDGVLEPRETSLQYTPPIESVKITENMIETIVPKIPTCIIELSQYTFGIGDTATVTITFDTVVDDLTIDLIVAGNGSITNLLQDTDSPWIYTCTFTPDADVTDDTNVIQVTGSGFRFHDAWGNGSDENHSSDNYTVNTEASATYEMYISFESDNSDATPDVGTIVHDTEWASAATKTTVDSTNVDRGITYTHSTDWNGATIGGIDSGNNSGELYDSMYQEMWWYNPGPQYVYITLPAGTYNISIAGGRDNTDSRRANFIIDGTAVNDIATAWDVWAENDFAKVTDISGGRIVTIQMTSAAAQACYMSGIKIERTA